MIGKLEDKDWDLLLERIKQGKCTPFIGAGACYGTLPLGKEVAQKWAKAYNYPLDQSSDDLVRVSQFVAVDRDDFIYPKDKMLEELNIPNIPDFSNPYEPHRILADLPLPIYMTTNYDSFMVQALRDRKRAPSRELYRWNSHLKKKYKQKSVFDSVEGFVPTPANPLVFHLHGHNEDPESLVLTEDDYLDFLVNTSKDDLALPFRIQEALTGSSLLFIGYSLADWSFRVLFRGFVMSLESSLRRMSVTVQLPPDSAAAQDYLDKYFNNMKIRAYWGDANGFAKELRERWDAFSNGNNN